jgi:stearoyl-CoA desaturase (delta-9 desaturase)
MLYAHMGWIFFKPRYERMALVDKEDLENDPVVAFQHKYYVPIAVLVGFILPPCLGYFWGDGFGAFIWGGLVARVLSTSISATSVDYMWTSGFAVWHCVFAVNSLAHWHGLQPFTDEDTSKGNLVGILIFSTSLSLPTDRSDCCVDNRWRRQP